MRYVSMFLWILATACAQPLPPPQQVIPDKRAGEIGEADSIEVRVDTISPSSARPGEIVTITGQGFMPDRGVGVLLERGEVKPLFATESELRFVVPELVRHGPNQLRVVSSGFGSAPVMLQVEYPPERPYIQRVLRPTIRRGHEIVVLAGHLVVGSIAADVDETTRLWPYSISADRAVLDSAALSAGKHTLKLVRTDTGLRSETVDLFVVEGP